jgi:hypothetical protein
MMSKKENYAPPQVKVVQFMIEHGFVGSIKVTNDNSNLLGENYTGLYNDAGWGTSFTTSGEGESHYSSN